MKLLCFLFFVLILAGCAETPPVAVEPTDGPCGPGAWTVTQGPNGAICKPGKSQRGRLNKR